MSCYVYFTGTQAPLLKCDRCGGTDPFSLPMTVDQLAALVKAFQLKHATCKPEHPKWKDVKK